MSAETDIAAIREALEETAAHLYSQQDGARCRGLAKDSLAALDRLSAQHAELKACLDEALNKVEDEGYTLSDGRALLAKLNTP